MNTLTKLERYNKIDKSNSDNELKVLKFFFANSVSFMNYTCRKFRSGVKVITPLAETYYEYNRFSNIILSYPIENGKIGQCNGEIVLDEFESSLKRQHDLIKL